MCYYFICVTIVPDLCQSAIQEIQRNDIAHSHKLYIPWIIGLSFVNYQNCEMNRTLLSICKVAPTRVYCMSIPHVTVV